MKNSEALIDLSLVNHSLDVFWQIKGGAAETDGRLMVGDEVIVVNGEDVHSATQDYAAKLLKVCFLTWIFGFLLKYAFVPECAFFFKVCLLS